MGSCGASPTGKWTVPSTAVLHVSSPHDGHTPDLVSPVWAVQIMCWKTSWHGPGGTGLGADLSRAGWCNGDQHTPQTRCQSAGPRCPCSQKQEASESPTLSSLVKDCPGTQLAEACKRKNLRGTCWGRMELPVPSLDPVHFTHPSVVCSHLHTRSSSSSFPSQESPRQTFSLRELSALRNKLSSRKRSHSPSLKLSKTHGSRTAGFAR